MAPEIERTTIYLDKSLKRLLKQAAKARDVTEAEIIREALAAHLRAARIGSRSATRRFNAHNRPPRGSASTRLG
jgi:hypothetical protein